MKEEEINGSKGQGFHVEQTKSQTCGPRQQTTKTSVVNYMAGEGGGLRTTFLNERWDDNVCK